MRAARRIVGLLLDLEVAVIVAVLLANWGGFPFGITPYTILSGSMEPSIPVGSLVYVDTDVEGSGIAPDEVIAFNIDEARTKICTHRVVYNDIDSQSIRTKGDANTTLDAAPVTYDRVVGRVVWSIPHLGSLLSGISEHRTTTLISVFSVLLATGILLRALSRFEMKVKPKKETLYDQPIQNPQGFHLR